MCARANVEGRDARVSQLYAVPWHNTSRCLGDVVVMQ